MDRLSLNDINVKQKSTTFIHKTPMDLIKVAERFKELRFRTKKSQMELADMLGVDQKRISRTEQGQQDLNGSFLESLKEQTNVNINWLLFGEGKMFSANTGSNIETMPVYKMWV